MNYRLTPDLRKELKKPFGRMVSDEEMLALSKKKSMVVVGDASAYFLLKNRRFPRMAITDGKVMRKEISEEVRKVIDSWDADEYKVENPPSQITEGLQEAIKEHINNNSTLIRVDGEEDLAVIPCILNSPLGTLIVYGQPKKSMVVVEVTGEMRRKASEILNRMEVF